MNGSPRAGRRRLRRWALWLALCCALAALQMDRPVEADSPRFDFAREIGRATLEPETRFLDLGTREARPSLLSGWSVDELWQGKTSFVWAMGQEAALRFNRAAAEPFILYFRCRPFAVAGGMPQVVTILVNGAKVGLTRLAPEFRSYRLAIPGAVLRSGENRLELRFATSEMPPPGPGGRIEKRRLAVAWDWIGFGTPVAPPSSKPQAVAREGSLWLPFRGRLDFYVEVQPGTRLGWQAIRPWRIPRVGAGTLLEVQVEWDGGGAGRTLRFSPGSFSTPQSIPLANRVATLARIGFLARLGPDADGADGADGGLRLVVPELLGTGPPPAGGGLRGEDVPSPGLPSIPAEVRPTARPNVVLYMIDTLRADHLGVYGCQRPISPEIDDFAAQATVFTHAFAQSGWTKSSVASVLTGLRPLSHGVAEPADALPDSLRTLPEMLRQLGYQTLAVTTNPAISAESGFARGFDSYVGLYDRRAVDFVAEGSDQVNAEFFGWLGARDRARPFFAFLHTMDPHAPYTPPPPYRQRFAAAADGALCRPGPREIAAALAAHPGLTRDDVKSNFEALYDAQVAHNDADFGLLLRRLRGLGLYGNTVVVLVSDHGEEFLDHGSFAHGHSLYQEILRVPLIVRWPDGLAAGRRVESAAQHVDLLPTILAAAGARSPAGLPGMDLRLLAAADAPVEREVSSDLSMAGTRVSSLVARGMHLLVRERPNPDVELYDVAGDPREERNLLATPATPATAETAAKAGSRMATASPPGVRLGYLMSRLRTLHGLESAGTGPKRAPISSEAAARLRALGYLH
jgi:choline-sulfatase